jgi:hypothetical protein
MNNIYFIKKLQGFGTCVVECVRIVISENWSEWFQDDNTI